METSVTGQANSLSANRSTQISERVADIARRLIVAGDLFHNDNPWPEQWREGWSVRWYVAPEAEAVFTQAVDDIVRLNPTQLSRSDTASTITYRSEPSLSHLAFDGAQGRPPVNREELAAALQGLIQRLAAQRRTRPLQFIIENLMVEGEVPRFFGVTLTKATEDEIQALYDDPLTPNPQNHALAFATVEAPGDDTAAYEDGVLRVERFLSLIQGCGSDKALLELHPIDLIGRRPVVVRTPVRERTPYGTQTSLRISFGDRKRRVARVPTDLLFSLRREHIEALVSATTTHNATSTQVAIVASLETLGEACEPNLATTRMLLASSALEMLVGYTPSDDISFRGQTAAIAERTTFLVGGSRTDDRVAFDRRVRGLYRKGSGVRHGGRPLVAFEDVAELAGIARDAALALLLRPDLKDSQALDTWIQRMRYTTALSTERCDEGTP